MSISPDFFAVALVVIVCLLAWIAVMVQDIRRKML
jgi:hypothetical protein